MIEIEKKTRDVQRLPSMLKALSSIPSIAKRKKKALQKLKKTSEDEKISHALRSTELIS
jgi:hypothetical protein